MKGFLNKVHRPFLHSAHSHGHISMTGNDNHRDFNFILVEHLLQIQATRFRHTHIKYYTPWDGSNELRNALAEAHELTLWPTDCNNISNECRTAASSSTMYTITSEFILFMAILLQKKHHVNKGSTTKEDGHQALAVSSNPGGRIA